MSGSIFGNVPQIQVPDYARTRANYLAMLTQQRQMDQQDALQNFFANNAQGFAASDPAKRMNVLSMLAAQGGQGAAMALPMLNQERQRQEFQDIMRGAMGGGAAPAPAAAPQAGGDFVNRLVMDESAGDPNARNPRSSATGAGQFIDSTWLRFAQANPNLFQGMSREQILAARTNPDLSRRAIEWYAAENTRDLSGAGLPVNSGTLALSHRFGSGDSARLLQADPNAPIASVVSEAVMRANPDLAGRTVGQVVGRYAQRFGGDATSTQNRPAPTEGSQPQQGGNVDVVARMDRAIAALTQAGRLEEAARLSQIAAGLRRGESEPLERVRRPDGTEVLVPRSRAAGMESAPAPRETPGPFGNERRGRALQAIEELGPVVARGQATEEQLRRYGSAVTDYQQEEVRPDGARVTPRLPPYAPGMDWVANRYPGFQFNGAPTQQVEAPSAPAQGGPVAVPTAGDATPAAPTLPPPGGAPGLPGATGGVTRDGPAMEAGTRRQIEEQVVGNQDALSRLLTVQQSFRPEYQTYAERWTNLWASLRERGGGRLSAQETERLRNYTQARAAALENLNQTIKDTTGAAMTESEAARITATMPNPGTGMFDGDSPTEFQAKLDRAVEGTRRALIRRHYALSRGLNPTQTGIELSEIPGLVDRRGREIEAEVRQGSPGVSNEQIRQQVRVRLRQEFGI